MVFNTCIVSISALSDDLVMDNYHLRKANFALQLPRTLSSTPIISLAGDYLGCVSDILLDILSGRIAYAIVSAIPNSQTESRILFVPWVALSWDCQTASLCLAISQEKLEGAPALTEASAALYASVHMSLHWAIGLHEYYGVLPYWSNKHKTQLGLIF